MNEDYLSASLLGVLRFRGWVVSLAFLQDAFSEEMADRLRESAFFMLVGNGFGRAVFLIC
jgi:hypothetical protein